MLTLDNVDSRIWKRWVELTDEHRRRLSEQRIEPGNPGTILNDIQTMLEFVGEEGLVTKSRNAALPAERLLELNARIRHPIQLHLKRALLRDYPNLAGLFILLRVMNLYEADENRLRVNPSALAVWRDLNPIEQYFALLEALLFLAQSSVLAEERRGREVAEAFDGLTLFLSQLTERWHTFQDYESIYTFGSHGDIRPWKLFLLEQLGLIELQALPQLREGRRKLNVSGWLMGGAKLTHWGTAVTWALLQFAMQETNGGERSPRSMTSSLFDMLAAETGGGLLESAKPSTFEPQAEFDLEQLPFEGAGDKSARREPAGAGASEDGERGAEDGSEEEFDEPGEEAGFGALQPVFQPYFPEWQKVYGPPKDEERAGTHVFKVSITGMHGNGRVWRRLAVPPDASLDDLAYAILGAYDFEDDHLWDFRFRDQRGKNRQYNRPEGGSEGPHTNEISVADTGLPLKGAMIFTFDYGDSWEFKVVLEDVEPGRSRLKHPKVVALAGEAPEQYPSWED